jgi:hypothetical protein
VRDVRRCTRLDGEAGAGQCPEIAAKGGGTLRLAVAGAQRLGSHLRRREEEWKGINEWPQVELLQDETLRGPGSERPMIHDLGCKGDGEV